MRRWILPTLLLVVATSNAADAAAQADSRLAALKDEAEQMVENRARLVQQIIDHMSFLMMAAHDTTTSTLTSMLYELGRHPEWQDRIREESMAFGASDVGFDQLDRFPSVSLVHLKM